LPLLRLAGSLLILVGVWLIATASRPAG